MGCRVHNTSEFIAKAKLIHGEVYDYSKVVYKRAIEKVEILCVRHGLFLQQPNNHLTGYGCKRCAIENTAAGRVNEVSSFIRKARELHGNKYDYSLVVKGMNEIPVQIICPVHGVFNQPPIRHLFGKGCKKCATERTTSAQAFTIDEWVLKAREVHGDAYDYSSVVYKNKNSKITITCRLHGDFCQTPHNHLYGNGCQICAKIIMNHAYKRIFAPDANSIPCSIYIIKIDGNGESFFKIGISTNIAFRFRELKARYDVKIVKLFTSTLFKSVTIEQSVLRNLKSYQYVPSAKFGGYKECLRINPLNELLKQINEF